MNFGCGPEEKRSIIGFCADYAFKSRNDEECDPLRDWTLLQNVINRTI